MDTKDVIIQLRNKFGLSQDELAEKVFVTRQAVSRWETGETVPNTETLKLLSTLFDVSINTLLGAPRELFCRCCNAPLNDSILSKDSEGAYNEDFCCDCYANGTFTLDFWQRYAALGGEEMFEAFKQQLMNEFNALHIDGLPEVESLNVLPGRYINMEYILPSGRQLRLLDDGATYLGNQYECAFGGDRCFGIAANMDFLLVCTYEEEGRNPELVLYKKR